MTGPYGIRSQLAASASGNLSVQSESNGSFVYVNDTHGTTKWTMVWATSGNGCGWNDIVYTTNRVAWVVRASLGGPSFCGQGKLYVTHDAGKDWYIHPIRSA